MSFISTAPLRISLVKAFLVIASTIPVSFNSIIKFASLAQPDIEKATLGTVLSLVVKFHVSFVFKPAKSFPLSSSIIPGLMRTYKSEEEGKLDHVITSLLPVITALTGLS